PKVNEAARRDWVTSGEVVTAGELCDNWGCTPQELAAAAERGEVFAVVVDHHDYYPREFLALAPNVVREVVQALGALMPGQKLIFWKRAHGALAGNTIAQVLLSEEGLTRVVQLAKAWT